MRKIIGIVLLAVFMVTSCRNKEQLGPDLVVKIKESLAVSNSSVDFSAGESIYFTAKFERDVIWILTITGSNGAKKIFNGVGKEVNAQNSSWIGTADVLPSFIAGAATATLSFSTDPQTQSVPVTIVAKRVSDLATDVLVTDFVTAPVKNYGTGTFLPTDWPSDFPNTSNNDPAAFPEGTYPFPDDNKYLIMGPFNPHQGNGSPYVDLLRIYAPAAMGHYAQYFPISSDSSRVYFNIMVYNTGTPTWLQVSLFEGTDLDNPVRTINIKPNWTGWKLVSVKYSDFQVNSPNTPLQSEKISGIQLVLLSNVSVTSASLPTTNVKAAFDHITFTHDKPYQP